MTRFWIESPCKERIVRGERESEGGREERGNMKKYFYTEMETRELEKMNGPSQISEMTFTIIKAVFSFLSILSKYQVG